MLEPCRLSVNRRPARRTTASSSSSTTTNCSNSSRTSTRRTHKARRTAPRRWWEGAPRRPTRKLVLTINSRRHRRPAPRRPVTDLARSSTRRPKVSPYRTLCPVYRFIKFNGSHCAATPHKATRIGNTTGDYSPGAGIQSKFTWRILIKALFAYAYTLTRVYMYTSYTHTLRIGRLLAGRCWERRRVACRAPLFSPSANKIKETARGWR